MTSQKLDTYEIDKHLAETVRGSIDMHVHFVPDPNYVRRMTAMETARYGQEMGLRAIVLKSSDYPTAPLADYINSVLPDITVIGGLVLNFEVGALNPFAVECSAKLGAKVLWMPTLASANCRDKIGQALHITLKGKGISILDAKGELLPEVKEILDIAKQYNMVVASGHISPEEIFKMVDYAQDIGIWKLVITHALALGDPSKYEKGTSLAEQKQLAERGVFIEHCFIKMLPLFGRLDPKEFVNAIRTVGAEHCIMSTDLGQGYHPPAPEGMRMFIGHMLRSGLTEKEVNLMAKENPARLLSL